jgi:PAS domain S-box-containing protein
MKKQATRKRARTGVGTASPTLSDREYQALASALPQLIWAVDGEGRIEFLSEQWAHYTGVALDILRTMDRSTLVHPDDLGRSVERWKRSLASGTPFESRHRLRNAAGEFRWQLVRGVPIRDTAGHIVRWVGTLTDIHEQVATEGELVTARNEAEQSRIEAETANRIKDDFLAIVSHELRAPLNAIGGWAGVLRVGKLDAPGIEKAAAVIEKNVRAQAKMIEDLLDVSRIVSGKFRLELQPFDPRVAVDGAIEALRPAASAKGLRVELVKPPQSGAISGDPNRLQQAVLNLVSNAVKFTEAGGEIHVALGYAEGFAEIEVRDTGSGIAPELLPRLFERFRQADASMQRRFGGLGLGLAIVRHIVELHGGSVRAESEGEGRGARFLMRIPLAGYVRSTPSDGNRPADAQNGGGAKPAAVELLSGLRLLSVDDEADASEVLKAALEQYGAQVTTVASAAAALDMLAREPFDVLVSDIGMPGMNGYELLRCIRNGEGGAREIPAIAVTGFARREDRERALKAGYRAHVVKPIEPDELAAAVRAAAGSARESRAAHP